MPGKYAAARVAMVDSFQSHYRCYGYRRIRSALLQHQLHISEKVVVRLMKQKKRLTATVKAAHYRWCDEKRIKVSLGSLSPI
jgi:transposase InsO family protein